MGLQMKTFKQVLNNMADWVTSNSDKLTNFYVGSVVRTLLEAIAVEIESMYFQMHKGFKYAIENSIYNSFDFYKFPATAASGNVIVSFKSPLPYPLTIKAGYRFATIPLNGQTIYFDSTQDIVANPGAITATIPVQCTQTGLIGNVPANSIRVAVLRIDAINSVTNVDVFYNGRLEETKEERKRRFTKYIDTLSRGTVAAIQYGCLRVTDVAGVYVDDTIGAVSVYVHDANGDLPDSLKQEVINSLLDYRPAGIQVSVLPVVRRPIDLDITVTLQDGFDPVTYTTLVQDSVMSFLNSFPVSKSLVRAELIKQIMNIDENAILNTTINLDGDITVLNYELIRPGNISVTIA